jgi:hypothetical protein
MNLKFILSTAGVALLSLISIGAANAQNCGFDHADVYANGCVVRYDTCGGVTDNGKCEYTLKAPAKPPRGKERGSICPKKVAPALAPPFVHVSLKGTETE